MFTSYAQNFEDVMLWRALKHVPHGFYIDVGAQDPIVDSVSMGFYEQGWRGVHIEPVAFYAERLRKQRPDETVIQAALSATERMLTFFEFSGTGLSTADRVTPTRHEQACHPVREVVVPSVTLTDVLAQQAGKEVHWLKIDVEGYEREVLKGWEGEVNPWIVVIESTSPLTQLESHQDWEQLILGRGYTFAYFDGLNRFYVSPRNPELRQAFRFGPNVFDGFTLSGTATAPYCAQLNSQLARLREQASAAEARGRDLAEQIDLAAARVQSLEHRIRVTESHAVIAEQEAHALEVRLQIAEKHIAAMTRSVSWRITAPLRWLRRVVSRGRRASGSRLAGFIRRAVVLAKRTGLYARVTPWVRERYPGLWLRAKRVLLDTSPRAGILDAKTSVASASARDAKMDRRATGGSDAAGTRRRARSMSVEELQVRLEEE